VLFWFPPLNGCEVFYQTRLKAAADKNTGASSPQKIFEQKLNQALYDLDAV
jgi:hypothetical protein